MNNSYDNAMRRQVYSLPTLIGEMYDQMEEKTRAALSFEEIYSLQHIIITGCGDSLAAAMAAKGTFEKLCGFPIDVMPAIDVARFYPANRVGGAPNYPLLIAISGSGRVSRINEAVQRIGGLGGLTLGLTADGATPLAKNCKKVLEMKTPSFESAPGVRGYLSTLEVLLLLAIRIGEVRGRYTMDVANDYRKDIKNTGKLLEGALESIDTSVLAIAERWQSFAGFEFVGAGSDYAAAWYGHAKILEAAGCYAMHINTEEWLHLNFFLKHVETTGTVMVFDDENASRSRAIEAIGYMQQMKRPLMVVTDDDSLSVPAESLVLLPKTRFALASMMLNFVPQALLAGYISELQGEPYTRAFRDNWEYAKDASGIWESKIEII